MLVLKARTDDYILINGNIKIQFRRQGDSLDVLIDAPREVPIARGKTLERELADGKTSHPPGATRHPPSEEGGRLRRRYWRDGAENA
jgi:sRNA-binding carbon storage regulator CsrA